jgi:hypothetical protein
MNVLFDDEHLVAVSKSENILAVPGKTASDPPHKQRSDLWTESVRAASRSEYLPEEGRDLLMAMIDRACSGLPRNKSSFVRYFKKNNLITRGVQLEMLDLLWSEVQRVDFNLHNADVTRQKDTKDISVCELLETKYNRKMYHVHRLDQETSGVILFAKTSEAASIICKQFRDCTVVKTYVAKVFGHIDPEIKEIDLPICADLPNRPYQVISLSLQIY